MNSKCKIDLCEITGPEICDILPPPCIQFLEFNVPGKNLINLKCKIVKLIFVRLPAPKFVILHSLHPEKKETLNIENIHAVSWTQCARKRWIWNVKWIFLRLSDPRFVIPHSHTAFREVTKRTPFAIFKLHIIILKEAKSSSYEKKTQCYLVPVNHILLTLCPSSRAPNNTKCVLHTPYFCSVLYADIQLQICKDKRSKKNYLIFSSQ